jgi:chemotaxis protein CheX
MDTRGCGITAESKRRVIEADTNAGVEWITRLDEAVGEVFQSMLERNCAPVKQDSASSPDISARITFSGSLEAQCVVEFPAASAERLTNAFLGVAADSAAARWDDAMIGDAVGELCNMIAGGWKKRLGAPALGSDLSVPTIFRGPSRLPADDMPQPSRINMRRAYAFDDAPFVVSLTIL